MYGPFEIELKVHVTDGDRSATVGYSLPVGKLATKDHVDAALKAALEGAQAEVGPEWRMKTRNEFENAILSERYGGLTPHFATKDEWDGS